MCACLEVRVALGAQPGFEWGVCSRACAGGAGAHGRGFVLRVPNFVFSCENRITNFVFIDHTVVQAARECRKLGGTDRGRIEVRATRARVRCRVPVCPCHLYLILNSKAVRVPYGFILCLGRSQVVGAWVPLQVYGVPRERETCGAYRTIPKTLWLAYDLY